MMRLWRRFIAWLNEPDIIYIEGIAVPHPHCPLCDASKDASKAKE